MRVYTISAITLKVNEMERSCRFYSKIPGFRVLYGGGPNDSFSTFEISVGEKKAYLNLEIVEKTWGKVGVMMSQVDLKQEKETEPGSSGRSRKSDFGRIIFHTEGVDELYRFMKKNETLLNDAIFETEPSDAPWGERYFHDRDPDGYQLSFAQPLRQKKIGI